VDNLITVPIYWTKTYKTKADKTVLVGMNFYRNAHYFDQNRLKQEFEELIIEQLDNSCVQGTYKLDIRLYYKNPSCDGANICSLVEKILLDALQKNNTVEQDNVKHHLGTTWSIAGQDKVNPRCEIYIRSVNE